MATTTWIMQDVKGLTPSLDMRRGGNSVFALSGKNFLFDSKGPKSSFGNRMMSDFALPKPEHIQGIRLQLRVSDRVFEFEGNQILEWKQSTAEWIIIYATPDTTLVPYRWTSGYLNGKVYFCHPAVGILEYDPETGVCELVDDPGAPDGAIALCVDNGRLLVITPYMLHWSAQSNGRDYLTKIAGAGFQLIADKVSGQPIMVQSYSRGVLVWTTGGVMRSEFTGDEAVYRHRALNTEYRPINSFCTAQMDDNTLIFLDERGLFQSNGEVPAPLTPLFNEFLIQYIQDNNLKIGQNIRIEWDSLKRLLFISVSMSFVSPIYERAFVLYPPLDKWGSFDEPHYGIIPIRIDSGTQADDFYGFVGTDKKVRRWVRAGSREASLGVLEGLDARLRVGLIRFEELSNSNDQLTEVNQVMVGNIVSGAKNELLDYNLVPEDTADEDYNVATGAEDFGFGPVNYTNHKLRIIGTIDGASLYDSEYPKLIQFTAAGRYYSCTCQGIWHIIEVSAEEVGEMFHLQALELTASPAGTL